MLSRKIGRENFRDTKKLATIVCGLTIHSSRRRFATRLNSGVRTHMTSTINLGSKALVIAGILMAITALAHLACIVIRAPAYRFMGAGERMASAAEAGKLEPTITTLVIACIFGLCSFYAISGAGIATKLPFTKYVLILISAVLIARAFAFPLLKPSFPDNSESYWLISSGICLIVGGLYAFGTALRWSQL